MKYKFSFETIQIIDHADVSSSFQVHGNMWFDICLASARNSNPEKFPVITVGAFVLLDKYLSISIFHAEEFFLEPREKQKNAPL